LPTAYSLELYIPNSVNNSTNLGSEGLGAFASTIFPSGSIKIKRGRSLSAY